MPGFELESTEACCGEDDDVITDFFVVANFTLKEIDFFPWNIFPHFVVFPHLGHI